MFTRRPMVWTDKLMNSTKTLKKKKTNIIRYYNKTKKKKNCIRCRKIDLRIANNFYDDGTTLPSSRLNPERKKLQYNGGGGGGRGRIHVINILYKNLSGRVKEKKVRKETETLCFRWRDSMIGMRFRVYNLLALPGWPRRRPPSHLSFAAKAARLYCCFARVLVTLFFFYSVVFFFLSSSFLFRRRIFHSAADRLANPTRRLKW